MPPKYGIPQPDLYGDELLKRVQSIRKYNSQYDDYQLAAALGLPIEIYKGRYAWATDQHRDKMKTWSLGTPLTIRGNAVIVGDVHCPYTEWEYAHLVTMIGAKHLQEPRILIIAGDLFNLDIFSDYSKLVAGPNWSDEKKSAQALAQEWAGVYDAIYFLAGNHDRRIAKKTDGELNIPDLAELLSISAAKITPSLFGYATLESGGTNWRVTHAKNYSINRLTVAGELALKYQTNIISYHEHHQGIGWDRYGRYCIVNGGSLVRQGDLAYASLEDGKNPIWSTGFVMVRDGTPALFGKAPITNWKEWL